MLYAHDRGLRYPRLSLEHSANRERHTIPHASLILKDAIATNTQALRAIAPEPEIRIETQRGQIKFTLSNVSPSAQLNIRGRGIKLINEDIDGLNRTIYIDSAITQTLNLKWQLDASDGFEFAVMGDTGGGSELAWTLQRAHALGATFLLHLGDFNYSEGEYDSAIELFKSAPLPCYVTIGNHDFHDNGLIYQQFLDQIGPMNHAFELAGARFVNIDTAADFFPTSGGQRGKLFNNLLPHHGEQIFFTHRPLKDPRPHDDHEVGSINEVDWLSDKINALGGRHYLHGHVHHSAEFDFKGLRQVCVGEGLGYENLVLQKQVAKIMMAKIEPGSAMTYRWLDLELPWSAHQNPTHAHKLKKDGYWKQLDWYRTLLSGGNA